MESNQELCRWLGENLMEWKVVCHGQSFFVPDDYYYAKSDEHLETRLSRVDGWTPDVDMRQAWQIVDQVKTWPQEMQQSFTDAMQAILTERGSVLEVRPLDVCLAAKRVLEESRKEQEA